ncbi:uncharacterized protein LOC108039758 [Drosophila rhopaloa]|uniref:Uncharacterized protein LOC108039758 n=1 Tax=Drosophila rhopaloa TaxID=1041015 RepID=A0A6P4E735_DRORH|nr:uncharacterized protein LOC108039758 [Drosophila rhopaloa]
MSSAENILVNAQICARSSWQTIRRTFQNIPRLKRCFYFFNLKKGCSLIATFEAIMSVTQICSFYHLVNQSIPSAMFPDPFWVTRIDRDGIIKRLFLYHTNHHFRMGLALVTVLNSMILFIGSKWRIYVCLYLWIYISLFTTLMTNIDYTLRNICVKQFLLTLPSITIETYFAMVVGSLISKIQEKYCDCNSDIEVLSSESEEL